MPRLQIVRLPNDHTHGATPGWRTPTAYAGDNDLALGQLVEAVSHSKFWPQTAIFVVEDDAQNGPDHVDAHRTTAFVISPYTKRGAVDSTMYSTSSMLRTMELILGLKPMSQFDAAATPMFNSFQATPDLRPYQAAAGQCGSGRAEQRPRLGRPAQDELRPGRRGGRPAAQRSRLALRARPRQPDARARARGLRLRAPCNRRSH